MPPVRRAAAVPDVAPAIALAPFGRAGVNGEGAPATTLPIVLKGIVFARPETLSIAYIANGSEAPKPYRINDVVSGASVQSIGTNRVLLSNGGRIEFLAFPDPFGQQTPAPGAAAAPGAPAPPPVTSAAPAPVDASAELARLGAEQTPGGYRIGANAPPGLRQGDVVSQINGQSVTTPEAARSAFSQAQANGTAQITIQRDGKPVTLTLPVR